MQPFIAITASEVINNGETWLPVVYGQYHTYTDAIVRAGGAPFIVPITHDIPTLRRLYDQCSGLLLTGGSDVNPETYDMPPASNKVNAATHPLLTNVSPQRDHQERLLLEWAILDNKPVLGICRGMQLLNICLGGDLHSDVAVNIPAAQNHEVNIHKKDFYHLAHQLQIEADSQLARALETVTIATNSLHHQTVKNLGEGLVVTARSEDGITEAIELPGKRFVIGVQSHPEALEAEIIPEWRKLFEAFVTAAGKPSR